MKNVLFLIGPALGHIVRVRLVIEALKRNHQSLNIIGLLPSSSAHSSQLIGVIDKLHIVNVHQKAIPKPYSGAKHFSRGFREFLAEVPDIDIIVQDINPQIWTSMIEFPSVPKVFITNAFLTSPAGLYTRQDELFGDGNGTNAHRERQGLKPLASIKDLYEAEAVLLADPAPIIELLGPWPENYHSCGPLCLSGEGDIPEGLRNSSNLLLCAMGSSGGTISSKIGLNVVLNDFDLSQRVYVGKDIDDATECGLFGHVYEWLAMEPVLKRASLCITHGGAGSTYLALSHGVPVMIFPKHRNHKLLADCLQKIGVAHNMSNDASGYKIPNTLRNYSLDDEERIKYQHIHSPSRHAQIISKWL